LCLNDLPQLSNEHVYGRFSLELDEARVDVVVGAASPPPAPIVECLLLDAFDCLCVVVVVVVLGVVVGVVTDCCMISFGVMVNC
jgi:hypothetical protein